MLEMDDYNPKEGDIVDRGNDENLEYKFNIEAFVALADIRINGIKVYLGEEPPKEGGECYSSKLYSMEQRREFYEVFKKHPNYTNGQFAKALYRESEFYPR